MRSPQRAAMAALAAVSLGSLAFLFGVVTERMRAGCERGTAVHQRAEAPRRDEALTLARDMEDR
ncbi:MAG TPA: hypothetical protein VE932_09215 [Patescibacteria group bacterium]|nr:hypothetical protein [Patescibacteria group bacterium]